MAREKINFESYGDTILLEHEELITSNVSEVYKLSISEERKRKIVEKYVEGLHIYPEYVSIWIKSLMKDDLYLIKYNEKFIKEELEKSREYMYLADLIGDHCLEDNIHCLSNVSNWSDCIEELLVRERIYSNNSGSLISKSNNLKNQIWLLPPKRMIYKSEEE